MIKKILVSGQIGILAISMFAFTLPALAQTASDSLDSVNPAATTNAAGIIVSPPITEKTMAPGESFSNTIKITNPTNLTLNVDVATKDFKANEKEDGGQIFVNPEENNQSYSLATWITMDKSFKLKPSETKEISYTIKAPQNAEPGGHYGVIFFTPTPEKSANVQGSGTVIIPEVGSLMLVTVSGEIKYNGKVADFATGVYDETAQELTKKTLFIDTTNKVDFMVRFQNQSTAHVKPTGTITIKNVLGKEVGSLVVNENQGNVLPDSIRKFESSWSKKYGFGPYKSELKLSYGDGQTINSILTFWIIPWKETLAVIVIIILIAWIFSRLQWRK